jgi:dihydroneopterin aldolase/2-amino-4-hydroxy-6-hydroxymethyldihydropteridine diphosphokinase
MLKKMLTEMEIKGLMVYAYHGHRNFNKEFGQKFIVNCNIFYKPFVPVENKTAEYKDCDDVNYTVSFDLVCKDICRSMREEKFNLMETCIKKIMIELFRKYLLIQQIKLSLERPAALLKETFVEGFIIKEYREWNKVYIGLGSNIDDRKSNLDYAVELIKQNSMVKNVKVSKYHNTKPVGYLDQNDFLNCVVEILTFMQPYELLEFTTGIEETMGRVRKFKNGPRNIDLDILIFGNYVINNDDSFVIPHPRMHERLFVLEPLCELNQYCEHPVFKKYSIDIKNELEITNKKEN